jgi:hypothetical protein
MTTQNEASDLKARIQQATQWLQEHEDETIITAARIFQLNRLTLDYSIHKAIYRPQGGYNWILTLN